MRALLVAIMEHTPTLSSLNVSGNYLGKAAATPTPPQQNPNPNPEPGFRGQGGSALLGELVGTSHRLQCITAADCRLDMDAFFEAKPLLYHRARRSIPPAP